jgi:predicted Rdx family selenoprotein
VAAAIKKSTGEASALISGNKGEFTIWVDDTQVADKIDGEFPEDASCVRAVESALRS